jgi:hypothetical protein
MVTHSSTSRPVQCLCMAERTEYTVVTRPTCGKAQPHTSRSFAEHVISEHMVPIAGYGTLSATRDLHPIIRSDPGIRS